MHKSVKHLYTLSVIARESFSVRLSCLSCPYKLVKLFYQNGSNHLGALREYHRLKKSAERLHIEDWFEVHEIEYAGVLSVQPGRRKKPVGSETVEVVAFAVVERAFSSIYSAARVRPVTRELKITWSTVDSAVQERQCLQTTIFMQDGATSHIGHQVKALLSENFGNNRVISRHFPDASLSRSIHLNPRDFWLWGYL
ncbi:uncharacterized protein TNCV_5081161 [Trichonephila clavipes]|nr:uncharacterized protein TNCV_5081161 [Trichonephila clavipes]